MKRRLSLVLVLCLLIVGCGGQKTATPNSNTGNSNISQPIPPQQDRMQLIVIQVDRAAVGLDAAIDVKRALYKDLLITQQQSNTLTQRILVVIRLVRELRDSLATYDSFEAGQSQFKLIFKRIQESFRNLKDAGVIPAGQATDKIDQALSITASALDSLGPLLGL